MRWDIISWCTCCCSGGRNWISCMFLGLQFEESQDRVQVLGKCWFLSAWSLWADRVSLLIYRELAQRRMNIHPFFLGWIFNSPGVLWVVVCLQKFSPGTEKSVLLPYNFKTICRQSRCLDLIVTVPVPCWCLWTYCASFYFCSPWEAHMRAFLDLDF